MFNYLINSIVRYVSCNIVDVSRGDVQDSFFSIGAVYAFTDVIREMGHNVDFAWNSDYDDDDCCQALHLVIDGIVLVEKNKINREGYNTLLEK